MKRKYTSNPLTLQEKLTTISFTQDEAAIKQLSGYASKQNWSYETFLERLLDNEITVKQEQYIQRRISQARFPRITTLDQFDFTYPKKINKKQVVQLFDLDFIEKREWVVFVGNSGVGKSHLAKALGYAACQKGYHALFTKTAHVVTTLQAAQSDRSFERTLKGFTRPDLLILDETGFLPLDQTQANLLFQLITDRYEFASGSTIITTNLAFKDWGRVFHDSVLAQAAVDRIVHRCQVVKIEGDSYRCKA